MSKIQSNIKVVFQNTRFFQYLILFIFLLMLYSFYGLDTIISKEAKDDIVPQIYYNGQIMKEYVSGPILINGHVMVPIRNFTEMLGVKPNWDPNEWIMTVKLNNKDVWLKVFQKEALVNGKKVKLPTPISLTYGYVYVPMELISSILDMDLKYENQKSVVYLKSR